MAGAERDRELKDAVRNFIAAHALLVEGQQVTVALSGGADSVSLLLLLLDMGYRVQAAHCNFHLRGEESDRDQHFAEELCRGLNVKLHIAHFDTQTEASLSGQSIEMAARELRYRWFASLAATVAVGHHRDDNIETMLLNLVRGTGLKGICGISPHSDVFGAHVVRPLLCIGRKQIEEYLARRGQPYVTDSTNLEACVRRNVIRLQVMPLLATLNPSIADTLQADMARFAESQLLADEALRSYAVKAMPSPHAVSVEVVDACPAPLSLLHRLLSPFGFNTAQTEQIFSERHGQSGAVYSSGTHRLLRHDGQLLLRPLHTDGTPFCIQLPQEGEVVLPQGGTLRVSSQQAPLSIVRDSATAMLDAAKLLFPLTLRTVRQGDRFRPFGMKGSKLVSDYLTDLHLSLFEKEEQLVVLSGDEIVWVVGRRISSRAALTPETKSALVLVIDKRQGT